MARNFVGSIILAILVIVGFVFMPLYYISLIDIAKSQEVLLYEAELILDKIADTRVVTESDMKDYTLAMAQTSIPINFRIIKEVKEVSPDPLSKTVPKRTFTTWVSSENIDVFHRGDIVTIEVKQAGNSFMQDFSAKALRLFIPKVDFKLSKMVR